MPCILRLRFIKTQEGRGGLGGEIQERSRRRGRFFCSHFPCRKMPKTWQGQHFVLPENGGMISSSVEICRKFFQQGISDSHSLLEFSYLCCAQFTPSIHLLVFLADVSDVCSFSSGDGEREVGSEAKRGGGHRGMGGVLRRERECGTQTSRKRVKIA